MHISNTDVTSNASTNCAYALAMVLVAAIAVSIHRGRSLHYGRSIRGQKQNRSSLCDCLTPALRRCGPVSGSVHDYNNHGSSNNYIRNSNIISNRWIAGSNRDEPDNGEDYFASFASQASAIVKMKRMNSDALPILNNEYS